MNDNNSDFEKISSFDSIDSMIKGILNWRYPEWDKKMLYSWTWALGSGYLQPKEVYRDSSEDFRVDKYDLSKMTQTYPDGIAMVKTFYKDKKTLFRRKRDVVLDLLIEGEDIGHSYHAVVSTVKPDEDLFGKGTLYSGIGKWDVERR